MDALLQRLEAHLANRYRLEREIGRGGMAIVYLAQDLRHHRRVAIKVLKPELAAAIGHDRFLREIEIAATLAHPNILPLHDSGAADGLLYYVMPYVEGESLRDLLQREGPLPVDEAIRIIIVVAGALDFAHRHRVVHRDIKPENILLQDGQPLVTDFGIALAVSAAGGSRLTETGLSLGTPQYMSPEQFSGEQPVTGRCDIYSLGAVAYEILVGEPPFTGPSAAAILARAVADPPRSLRVVRETIPPEVEAAILKALARIPADRFATAAKFASALAAATAGVAGAPPVPPTPALPWRRYVLGAGALGAATLLGLLVGRGLDPGVVPPDSSRALRHTSIILPDSAPVAFVGAAALGIGRPALALAPDASSFVYVARRGSTTQLYRRRLNTPEAEPLAGTEGAYEPFFSPDGRWVGFFVGYELRKVAVEGGEPITLAQVPEPAGATWSHDGRILVALREGTQYAWLDDAGGQLQPLPRLDGFNRTHPQFLPGEQWVLQTMGGQLMSLTSLETGAIKVLTRGPAKAIDSTDVAEALRGTDPHYLPSGHISYVAGGIVMALPFDASQHRALGAPFPILEGVRIEGSGLAQYHVADDGTLVYARGRDAGVTVPVWRSRDGRIDTLPLPPRRYGHFDLSPDGARLALTVVQPTGLMEIWIADLRTGVQTRPLALGEAVFPFWWPDGRRVAFSELRSRLPWRSVIIRELPAGGGTRDTLAADRFAIDVSNDGQWMSTWLGRPPGLHLRHVSDTGRTITVDPFPTAIGGTFSPDGRWLAYGSNQSGRYEIYAVARDGSTERVKLSTLGGDEMVWSSRGDELFYRREQRWFRVAAPAPGSSGFGEPELLFEGPFVNVPGRSYDVSPDGRHLLLLGPPEQTTHRLEVVTNWFSDVRQRSALQDSR